MQFLTGDDEVKAALCSAVEREERVVLHTPGIAAVGKGRLAELKNKRLMLLLDDPRVGRCFLPASYVLVTYGDGYRCGIFPARVLGDAPDPFTLPLRVPDAVMSLDLRISYRVPVGPDDGLTAVIVVGEGDYHLVHPCDISLCGMGFRFESAGVELARGDKLRVALSYRGVETDVKAEVRRAFDGGAAVFFPECMRDGEVVAPRAVQQIVRGLEHAMLRSRDGLAAAS